MTQIYNGGPATELDDVLSASLFRALCDPSRLSILAWLCGEGCECSVGDVADSGCCDVTLSVVSRHLKALREAGVLTSRRRGKEVLYSVRAGELAGRLRAIADALEACACCASPEAVCVIPAPSSGEK